MLRTCEVLFGTTHLDRCAKCSPETRCTNQYISHEPRPPHHGNPAAYRSLLIGNGFRAARIAADNRGEMYPNSGAAPGVHELSKILATISACTTGVCTPIRSIVVPLSSNSDRPMESRPLDSGLARNPRIAPAASIRRSRRSLAPTRPDRRAPVADGSPSSPSRNLARMVRGGVWRPADGPGGGRAGHRRGGESCRLGTG